MVWIIWTKTHYFLSRPPPSASAIMPGLSRATFSLCRISVNHAFTCLARILVAPPAHPFFNPDTTVRISTLVGTSSRIAANAGKLNGRGVPIGGALMYNSTCSAVCFAIVSGHAGGGRSSAALYHPLKACQASFTALLPRWLSTVDVALAVRCLQSAASDDLILQPIRREAVRDKLPILLNVARQLINSQD